MPHHAVAEAESVVQSNGVGPFDVIYADPRDDPRKKQRGRGGRPGLPPPRVGISSSSRQGAMHEDVTKFIEAYRDSFGRGPGAVAEFYTEPCLIAGTGGVRVNPTRHETERFLAEVDASHRTRGFTRSDIFALDVKPLGACGALATVRWGYLGACEELLGKATLSYNLYRCDGVWKILVETVHES